MADPEKEKSKIPTKVPDKPIARPFKIRLDSESLYIKQPRTVLPILSPELTHVSIISAIQAAEERAVIALSNKKLQDAVANSKTDAKNLITVEEQEIKKFFGKARELVSEAKSFGVIPKGVAKLNQEINDRESETLKTFYRAFGLMEYQRVELQIAAFKELHSSLGEKLKTDIKDSPISSQMIRLHELTSKIIPLLEVEHRRLKWISGEDPKRPEYEYRAEFFKHLNQLGLLEILKNIGDTKDELSRVISGINEKAKRAELLSSVADGLIFLGIAAATYYSGTLAAIPAGETGVVLSGMVRVTLFGSSLFATKRYYEGYQDVVDGKKSLKTLLREIAQGYPEDLNKAFVSNVSVVTGARFSGLKTLPMVPAGVKGAFGMDQVMTLSNLAERASQGAPPSPSDILKAESYSALRALFFGTIGTRYGQLQSNLIKPTPGAGISIWRQPLLLFSSELATTSVGSLVFEGSEHGWQELSSYQTAKHLLLNLPGVALAHKQNFKGMIDNPFPSIPEVELRKFIKRGLEIGLTEAQAAKLFPGIELDAVTGFYTKQHRIEALQRAIDQNKLKKGSSQSIGEKTTGNAERKDVYSEADIGNLSGLNEYYKKMLMEEFGFNEYWAKQVAKQLSNAVFKEIAKIYKTELSKISPQAQFFRHGGDEISAILRDVNPEDLPVATDRIRDKVAEKVAAWGLSDIPHYKENRPPGMGIRIGDADLAIGDLQKVLTTADKRIEFLKKQPISTPILPFKIKLFSDVPPKKPTARQVINADRDAANFVPQVLDGLSPFASPDQYRDAFNLYKLRKTKPQATLEEANKLFGRALRDPVLTEFYGESSRVPTLARFINDLARGGGPVHWISTRQENLAGLNPIFGASQANQTLVSISNIVWERITKAGGKVYGFRSSGGNLNFIVVGGQTGLIRQALSNAAVDVDTFVRRQDLHQILNPNDKSRPGISLSYGISEVRAGIDPIRVLAETDQALENYSKGHR